MRDFYNKYIVIYIIYNNIIIIIYIYIYIICIYKIDTPTIVCFKILMLYCLIHYFQVTLQTLMTIILLTLILHHVLQLREFLNGKHFFFENYFLFIVLLLSAQLSYKTIFKDYCPDIYKFDKLVRYAFNK